MASSKLKAVIIVSACATAIVTQQIPLHRSPAENADLRRQIASLRETPPTPQPTPDLCELGRLRTEHEELLRLRGQVAQLRRERDELSRKVSSLAALTNKPAALQNPGVDNAW